MGPSAKKTGKMLLYVLLTNNFIPFSFNYNTASNYDITACKYPHLKMKHKLGNYFPFPSESSLFPSHLHQVWSSALPSATNDKTKERSLKHPLSKLKTRYSRIYWALEKQQSEKHLLFLFKVFASFPWAAFTQQLTPGNEPQLLILWVLTVPLISSRLQSSPPMGQCLAGWCWGHGTEWAAGTLLSHKFNFNYGSLLLQQGFRETPQENVLTKQRRKYEMECASNEW